MPRKLATIDANFWALPEVWEAGFWGAVVFQQLLIQDRAHDCGGHLPYAITRPDYLARVMLLEEAAGLAEPPIELIRRGIRAAQKANLIRVTGDGIELLQRAIRPTSASRQKRYRDKKRKLGKPASRVTSRYVTRRNVPTSTSPSSEISRSQIQKEREESVPTAGDAALRRVTSLTPDITPTGLVTPVAQEAIDAWAERQHALLSGREPAGAAETVLPQSGGGVEGNAAPGARQKKAAREKPEPPQEALTLGILLAEYIASNHPTGKLSRMSERDKAAKAVAWSDAIRLLHERDRISYGEIEGMIHWSQKSSFWQTVILSGNNLRDKWDTMAAQRGRNTAKRDPGVGRAEPAPHATYNDGEVPV